MELWTAVAEGGLPMRPPPLSGGLTVRGPVAVTKSYASSDSPHSPKSYIEITQ